MLGTQKESGFTLIETLVVMAILLLLGTLLFPFLTRARESGRVGVCASNLSQLYVANTLYAAEKGTFVPAASDLFTANLQRWHGARTAIAEPFDGTSGPLAPFLGDARTIRKCPSFTSDAPQGSPDAFEAACGGYGYNVVGVGSLSYLHGFSASNLVTGIPPGSIRNPAGTVMFCDTAFGQPYGNPTHLIEYSFAEPYRALSDQGTETSVTTPSIHFRHGKRANVAWCDGHISLEPLAFPDPGSQADEFGISWLGTVKNNSLFDPF